MYDLGNLRKVGMTFDCPHCKQIRLGILFHHKGREAIEDAEINSHIPVHNYVWTIDTDDFSKMTVSPSVDASKVGHWHGFITGGEIK
jgi:hypothetical protein